METSFRMMVLLSQLLACLLFQSSCLLADDSLTEKIDRLVAREGFTKDGPGVAILIRQPGHVSFAKGYGLASLSEGTPVTEKTLFELASASKPMTATAVLLLSDRGKLSLDDDIRKHLPELPDYGSQRPITIRDLLHHTSGLPDYMDFEDVPAGNVKYWINEDYLSQFAAQKDDFPLQFKPGKKFQYNNTNYMLAATIVQRVSKKPFAEFMREEIFLPAGMTSTFVCDSPQVRAKDGDVTAIGYMKKGKKWVPTWGAPPKRYERMLTVGDGAIWTNLEDFAKWDVAVRTGKYFKPSTAKESMRPSKTDNGKANDYGLGWTLYFDGPKLIGAGHDGYWDGFSTTYYHSLIDNRTTIILSNADSYGGDEFWYAVDEAVDEYLEELNNR